MTPATTPANPCLNICRMDQAGNYCQGCGRTPLEIGRWPRMTEAERAEVMAALPSRLPWRSPPGPAPVR
ncbi:DUF1289 domain-containing protein [Cupriavidus necator]|uniref:DUF1289 domain-containing protein n=1 Tax=Cupriavidus necator TaxID=106590 RepID=UPI00339D4D03